MATPFTKMRKENPPDSPSARRRWETNTAHGYFIRGDTVKTDEDLHAPVWTALKDMMLSEKRKLRKDMYGTMPIMLFFQNTKSSGDEFIVT